MSSPVVEVRAYDLGGFGDIAGALRVASHLERGGTKAVIRPTSTSARKKLELLKSDVPVINQKTRSLQVDVAGHYRDTRLAYNPRETPHNFTEDMDNPEDRRRHSPIYIKSGMIGKGRQVDERLGGATNNPMFYRPFREWDLPKPGERDVRQQVADSIRYRGWGAMIRKGTVMRMLDRTDNVAFAHFQPGINSGYFFEHPYVKAMELGDKEGRSTALGLFFGKEQEADIADGASRKGYGIVRSDGSYEQGWSNRPTVMFLGPQNQTTTTSLFLSATVPNLVTGDLSLSDAIYGLLAMDGPAFFYDCPGWKAPTFKEMLDVFGRVDPVTADVFATGSVHIATEDKEQEKAVEHYKAVVARLLRGNTNTNQMYRDHLRTAIANEIAYRFGSFNFSPNGGPDGLYIPRGAPFLIQDATENVVQRLVEDADLMKEVEQDRKVLSGEAPAVVVTSSGAEAPTAFFGTDDYQLNNDPFLYSKMMKNYYTKSKFDDENLIYNTINKKNSKYSIEPYSKIYSKNSMIEDLFDIYETKKGKNLYNKYMTYK